MKKTKRLFLGSVLLLTLAAGCKKENKEVDYTVIDSEKSNIENAYELSLAYNDTLIIVYDTVLIRRYNPFCMKYDSLYHHSDSMFSIHYNRFCNEMYRYGIRMNNYTPSNGMMQGGMMNGNSVNMHRMMNDTTTVGGYYRDMQQLHSIHETYHSGIYN